MRFALVLLLIGICVNCHPNPPPSIPTTETWYAPDFTLTALDGTEYQLSDLRGQWIILNFWATWCTPCVAEMPALQAIAEEYAEQLIVLGINSSESEEEVAAFAAVHELRFPLLINPNDATLLNYQVIGLPQSVIISPSGEIVDRQFGPLELDQFRQKIRNLTANYNF